MSSTPDSSRTSPAPALTSGKVYNMIQIVNVYSVNKLGAHPEFFMAVGSLTLRL
jgi:hypothetical protein